jgi:phage-related protein
MAWEVIYHETPDGGCPVRDFLEVLPKPHRAKVFAAIALLQERGPALGFPYTSQAEGRIRELRTHYGRQLYRVLYFMDNRRRVVLLEAFEKDAAKVPPERLAVAMSRLQDQLNREG